MINATRPHELSPADYRSAFPTFGADGQAIARTSNRDLALFYGLHTIADIAELHDPAVVRVDLAFDLLVISARQAAHYGRKALRQR